jgi:hypothetical protein
VCLLGPDRDGLKEAEHDEGGVHGIEHVEVGERLEDAVWPVTAPSTPHRSAVQEGAQAPVFGRVGEVEHRLPGKKRVMIGITKSNPGPEGIRQRREAVQALYLV